MTHAELVKRAGRWLRNDLNCRVVLEEFRALTDVGETPDAIGWQSGCCIVVECKTSLADFNADRKKKHRLYPQYAMGDWRFYLTEPGLLAGIQLPDGYGWYEIVGRSVQFAGGTQYRNAGLRPFQSSKSNEVTMLVSELGRRVASATECAS